MPRRSAHGRGLRKCSAASAASGTMTRPALSDRQVEGATARPTLIVWWWGDRAHPALGGRACTGGGARWKAWAESAGRAASTAAPALGPGLPDAPRVQRECGHGVHGAAFAGVAGSHSPARPTEQRTHGCHQPHRGGSSPMAQWSEEGGGSAPGRPSSTALRRRTVHARRRCPRSDTGEVTEPWDVGRRTTAAAAGRTAAPRRRPMTTNREAGRPCAA